MDNKLFFLFSLSSLIYWLFGWFLLPKLRFLTGTDDEKLKNAGLSIIIPARNEEKRLPILLQSLKAEGAFEKYEVIVADDNSSDGTSDLAKSFGCKVLKVTGKPDEAQGKSWACAVASDAAGGDYFLFLDADVKFSAGGLSRLISEYREGMLSVQPCHVFFRFYESFSLFFNLMAMAGVNSFCFHSKPAEVKGAFGPCMLTSRRDYDEIGGHRAVVSELVDDLALAGQYSGAGKKVQNTAGGDFLTFRMYPEGFKSLSEGWMKNMAAASGKSSGLAGLYFGLWCAGVACCIISAAVSGGCLNLLLMVLCIHFMYSLQLYFTVRRIGSWNFGHCWIFPVYLIYFLYIMIRSQIRTRIFRFSYWKGRRINL